MIAIIAIETINKLYFFAKQKHSTFAPVLTTVADKVTKYSSVMAEIVFYLNSAYLIWTVLAVIFVFSFIFRAYEIIHKGK